METHANQNPDGQFDPNQIIKDNKFIVVREVNKIIKNRADAEELVQDVFIKVLNKKNLFNPSKGSFKSWLSTVAKNTALDFIRKKEHKFWNDLSDNVPDIILDEVEESPKLFICRKFLNNAFSDLNETQSTVLQLRFIEEKSYEEIALHIGIKVEYARVLNLRGIEQLKAIVKNRYRSG